MLKHGILGLLNYGNMTGYEIMGIFRDSLNYFWSANTSQIYRELGTLKKKGFATAAIVAQDGKPDKKIYSITEAGREELRLWLRRPDFGNPNVPLCMKTFFAGELPKEDSVARFRAISAYCEESLKRYEGIHDVVSSYRTMVSNPDAPQYWDMTLDYGMRYMKMLKEWSEHSIRQLEGEST